MLDGYGERMCSLETKKEADAGGGWRPISTAPKDGTHVLLYDATLDYVSYRVVGYFSGCCWWVCGIIRDINPTHWQPLPPPPAVSEPPKIDLRKAGDNLIIEIELHELIAALSFATLNADRD